LAANGIFPSKRHFNLNTLPRFTFRYVGKGALAFWLA
jgi:hypothetical protein